jgi:hypothetical protein
VLLTGPPDQGPYNQVLFWQNDRRDHAMLSRVARVALRNKKNVIKPLSNQGENTAEQLDILACPLFLGDKLLGSVAIEMTHRSLSRLRAAAQQVQAGAMWLEAMMDLPLDPAPGSKKRDKQPFAKKIFESVQIRCANWLGPRSLLLKVSAGLAALFLVGFFLVSTMLRVPSDSESEAVNRYAVVAPQQSYIINVQERSGDSAGNGGTVTPDNQEPPIDEQKSQIHAAQLPQEQSKTPGGSEHPEIAVYPTLSEEKTASVTSREISDQESSGTKEHRVLNSETETTTTNPIEELYSIEIGPILREQELKEAISILHGNGFDSHQTLGIGAVKVTRLLEGLYTREMAHERFNAIQNVVDSAFIIPEKGKLAIYVGTYHNRAMATEKIKQLAQKNIKVTAVTTELKMKGAILVVKQVDRLNIETITDQMSVMGLSVKVIKSG